LWRAYALRRATLADLSAEDGRSARQVQRVIRAEAGRNPAVVRVADRTPVVLVLDTSYFGAFGVMVFRCATRRQNLHWTFVGEETNGAYLAGIARLREAGLDVVAAVCDGKRWLAEQIQALDVPVQLCQFHFLKTMTRHLTRHPRMEAGSELRSLALGAKRLGGAAFTAALETWRVRHESFLAEKTVAPSTGRWRYTHRDVRAAYRTALRWLPNLFTYEKFPALGIPNTTNTLEGTFSHLKRKVNVHRGLNDETKRKMISLILNQPCLPKRKKTN